MKINTPPPGTLGAQPQLRVAATVTDANGVVSTVVSAASDVVGEIITGTNGNNTLVGGAGGDLIDTNGGNDSVNAGASDDVIIWNAGDGRDIIDGGTETVIGDTFIVNGTNGAEIFSIYTTAAWQALGGARNVAAGTEIIITRNGTTNASVIAELREIEEIVVNTNGGGFILDLDQVRIFGDFTTTNLSFNTITINGSAGDETVDISALESAHRILFRTQGGNDMVVGTLRAQDVIEAPVGIDPQSYVASFDETNGLVTLASEGSRISFAGSLDNLPKIVGASETVAPEGNPFTIGDAEGLLGLVRGISPDGNDDGEASLGVRDLPGVENNIGNPGQGAAGQPFLRITEGRYAGVDEETGAGIINPIFQGLDPRVISNILGAQEADAAQSTQINTFFMAFGQYFDHGLSFIPKGGVGQIQIGDPGSARAPGVDNPADLTRASVVGLDANGVPQHGNINSPFVDQNQVYGSTSLIGQLLRESDGEGGFGARVLMGARDPSAPDFDLLPTLRLVLEHHIEAGTVFRAPNLGDAGMTLLDYYPTLMTADGSFSGTVIQELAVDFMGEGMPLFIDSNPFINLLDHIVAGDGRVNENVTLTSMHTIFARNHNYHVENLAEVYSAQDIALNAEELFQAAKVVNEAEYQRVVFTEFAEKLLGGDGIMGEGDHGFKDYDPQTDAGISHEFAAAAYRIGHTMIGQTISVLNDQGDVVEIPLFDVFLNPTNTAAAFQVPDMDGPGPMTALEGEAAVQALAQFGYTPTPGYTQLGAGAVLGGIVQQAAEEIDVNIVDAVRNDLVRISADLFAFNVARGWDVGLGTLNQVRADLMASTNPYIAEAVGFAGGDLTPYTSWEDFQTRNGLSDSVIAQFRAAYPDLVLSGEAVAAFAAVNEDIVLSDNGDGTKTVAGIDRVDLWVGGLAEAKINGGLAGATFWVIMHEQFDRLQEGDRFYYLPRLENFDLYENFVEGQSFADIVMRNTGLTGLDERIFDVSEDDDAGPALPVIDAPVVDPAPETPVVVDPAPETPVVVDPEPETPVVVDPEPETPVVVDPAPETPVVVDPEPETPVVVDPAPETPVVVDPAPETPVVVDPAPETPVVVDPAPEAPVVVDPAPEAPVVVDPEPETPVVVDPAPETPVVVDPEPEAPLDTDTRFVFGSVTADQLMGSDSADYIRGLSGDDELTGLAGDDVIEANAGNDAVSGGAGNDLIFGDDGDDVVFGDTGNDIFVARSDDGSDLYFGGAGEDLIDLSGVMENATVDLGSLSAIGSIEIGAIIDRIISVENVIGTKGNDTIIASLAQNDLAGGGGKDSFVFTSAAAADGDVILDFAPGDVIDLTALDAHSGVAGNQGFTLATAGAGPAAGLLMVTEGDDGLSRIDGHTDDDGVADFSLSVRNSHSLTDESFKL
ncbi:peroxidase family protein [Roseovarius mucosus]|uniref:peroxidase family protein n=1 Tax=Roseovarius mucosus TaxID=215743 RepID=UPI003F701745